MKSNNGFREKHNRNEPEEISKKAVKLAPIKKSGKEKHQIYSSLQEEDEDLDLISYRKRESVLDYFDDEEDRDI